jgi:flagellar motor switch protein FliM
MADVLTQADIETLLGQTDAESRQRVLSAQGALVGFEDGGRDGVFRDPPLPLGEDQLQSLETLHEEVGQHYAAALSALLRSATEVKLVGIHQHKYGEFVSTLKSPTCFNVLRADPLSANWILDISPSIVFPIIDRLLGGGREPAPVLRRPLTEIELRLLARITGLFLDELHRGWMNALDLRVSFDRVESDPQFVQAILPEELVALIVFEIALGGSRGMMTLCVPVTSIHRIEQGAFAGLAVTGDAKRTRSSETKRDGTVQLVAQLADTKIGTADLVGLCVGDIITTDQAVGAPILVRVDGVPRFHAQLGAAQGRKAIRIDEAIVETLPSMPKTG